MWAERAVAKTQATAMHGASWSTRHPVSRLSRRAVRGWVAPFATPPQATAPKRTALAGAAPIYMVLFCRQALRPVRHATTAASDPTAAPCNASATTRAPASTDAAVCAARATVDPAAAVAYPRRPSLPPAPTGPTIDSLTALGPKPAARRPAAPDAWHGVLAHADWHRPDCNTES